MSIPEIIKSHLYTITVTAVVVLMVNSITLLVGLPYVLDDLHKEIEVTRKEHIVVMQDLHATKEQLTTFQKETNEQVANLRADVRVRDAQFDEILRRFDRIERILNNRH